MLIMQADWQSPKRLERKRRSSAQRKLAPHNVDFFFSRKCKIANYKQWVKAHAFELSLVHQPSQNIMKDRSIHVHCPSGAIPKDGPSSGMAQAYGYAVNFHTC